MELIKINPTNEKYFSDDFIKGFECGAKRQLEADKKDRPQGEWIDMGSYEVCKNCHEVKMFPHWNFCPDCGTRMNGADDE